MRRIAWLLPLLAAPLLFACGRSAADTRALETGSSTDADAPRSRATYGLSLAGQTKIHLVPESLTVSSYNQQAERAENLLAPGTDGYWHVRVPRREATAYLQIDLGRIPEPLATLRVRPRSGVLDQMWRGDRAGLQASNDGVKWTTLARLTVNRSTLTDDWIAFPIANSRAYRYYRLVFWDQEFKSLARVELYRFPGGSAGAVTHGGEVEGPITEATVDLDVSNLSKIELRRDQLTANSVNTPGERETVLVEPGIAGYWHAKVGRQEGEPVWLRVDLGLQPARVTALRIRPRAGSRDQMWTGPAAGFQGSVDGESWEPLAQLSLSPDRIGDHWIGFRLENNREFRYYRLLIRDPRFLSLARFELYSRAGGNLPPAAAGTPLVSGTKGVAFTSEQRIALGEGMLAVSSANSTGESAAQLVRAGTEGYWHVRVGQQAVEPSWVRIDLGSPQAVTRIRVRPRVGLPSQLWNSGQAVWQGSADDETWTPIARLGLARSELTDDWYAFALPGMPSVYRYYRLLITDPTFYSIGRIELFR